MSGQRPTPATPDAMRPPTLDLLYLTFNAAKHLISVPVFAHHLYNAFGENATSLPELVVFSLQEMAPLSSSFIGSYFLSPYFARYESALNLAAAKFVAEEERQHRPKDRSYTLVRSGNVGMTGILLFARDPETLSDIRVAEVGFGAGDMANKGAVGLRMLVTKEQKLTELTFVATHLAAMEWNLDRRNRNWESIVRGLVFADPRKIAERDSETHNQARPSATEDTQPLLFHPETEKALQDISVYKPGSHLFVAGDLNYRISKTSPTAGAVFPNVEDADSEDYFPRFLTLDQLTAQKTAGKALQGLTEAPIHFPPTYKYKILPATEPLTELGRIGAEEDEDEEVAWEFASHRWPGWCDRVLYLDLPRWAKDGSNGLDNGIDVVQYNCLPVVRTSDHRAVFLRVNVPMLSPSELAPGEQDVKDELQKVQHATASNEISDPHANMRADPRVVLPYEIDVDAWTHREAVKRWEVMIGWSMVISKSKQGIAVFSTAVLLGLGYWWYSSTSS